jgi:hypothetical protein
MAPVASSLVSELHLWVKIDDSFIADSKIVICLACNKSIGCFMKLQLEQHTPDQSTLRKHFLPICYVETLENISGNIGDAFIWVAVDETTDSVGRFIANFVGGKLDIKVPSNPHLFCSNVLHHISHFTLARFTKDGHTRTVL